MWKVYSYKKKLNRDAYHMKKKNTRWVLTNNGVIRIYFSSGLLEYPVYRLTVHCDPGICFDVKLPIRSHETKFDFDYLDRIVFAYKIAVMVIMAIWPLLQLRQLCA
jgi:hypothetical protein